MRKLLYIISFLFLLSCSINWQEQEKIELAEATAVSDPFFSDSIISTIDTANLSSQDLAKVNVIRSVARYFGDIPVDSSISILANVEKLKFNSTENKSLAMKGLMVQGDIFLKTGKIKKATECALRAKELATKLKDTMWIGRTVVQLAEISNATYNYFQSGKRYYDAAKIFKSIGAQEHFQDNILLCAHNLCEAQYPELAKRIADSVFEAERPCTRRVLQTYYSSYSFIYELIGDYDKALAYFDSLNQIIYQGNYRYNINVASLLTGLGKANEAVNRIEALEKEFGHDYVDKQPYFQHVRYNAYKQIGDYKNALDAYELYMESATNYISGASESNGIAYESEFYRDESDTATKQAIEAKKRMWFAIGFAIIFTLLVLMTFVLYKKRKDQTLETMASGAQSLREELAAAHHKAATQAIISKTIQNELLSKLQTLCREYSASVNSKEKQVASQEMTKAVREVFGAKEMGEIRNNFEAIHPGLLSSFCSEFPRTKEHDINLIILLSAGFGLSSISLIMEKKYNALCMQRARIRDKVAISTWPRKQELLNIISQQ